MPNERRGRVESTTELFTVERELTIAAQPETVWKLLVDPTEQSRWWGTPLDFEARPGWSFRVEVIPGHIASGEFVELDAPRRLVYTFGWEGAIPCRPAPRRSRSCSHPRA